MAFSEHHSCFDCVVKFYYLQTTALKLHLITFIYTKTVNAQPVAV